MTWNSEHTAQRPWEEEEQGREGKECTKQRFGQRMEIKGEQLNFTVMLVWTCSQAIARFEKIPIHDGS